MFGLGYVKVDPSTYLIHYVDGQVKREGRGLAFMYWKPSASLVAVPTGSVDVPFVFDELTADFQPVALQGQLTYRIADPKRVSEMLNFALEGDGRTYKSEDPEKLGQRLVTMTQVLARTEVQRYQLTEALGATEAIMAAVTGALRASPAFATLGVEVIAFALLAIRPTPELGRAIEAPAREGLQRRADEAIAERRNAAVEQERRIKENELTTEASMQEKRQALATDRLAADIDLEKQREALVAARSENARQEAELTAYALEQSLAPLRTMELAKLEVLAAGAGDPRRQIALAIKELATNAQKVGQLNLSPDLLTALMER